MKNLQKIENMEKHFEEISEFFPIGFLVLNKKREVVKSGGFLDDFFSKEKKLNPENLFIEKEELKDFFENQEKDMMEKELTLVLEKQEKVLPVNVRRFLKEEGEDKFYLFVLSDVSKKRKEIRELTEEIAEKDKEIKKKKKKMEDSSSALLNILEDSDENYKEAEKERIKTVSIIKNLIDGMIFFDSENRLTIINPKACEIFKINESDVVGKKVNELTGFDLLNPLLDFIEEKGEIKSLLRKELELKKDFHLEITTTRIDNEEEILGTLVHIHDVSREKRIERIKTEFVSVAAHQLRTPLSGIKWTLNSFLEELEEDSKLDEDEEFLIKKAYEANERMISLVNDLLNVSRIEEGRYIYKKEEIDILEIIDPIIKEYDRQLKENKNLKFEYYKPEKKIPKIEIDPEKISIVLRNFLDNAIKYTDEGKIILSVDIIEEEIKVSVEDEGIGIPKKQQSRLFDKFFRAENVVRKDVEGSGLGLFIGKNVIEAHGGKIGFKSVEDEGSLFYFTLPITN